MKRHIQIKNGYGVWRPRAMLEFVDFQYRYEYHEWCNDLTIANTKRLVIEWWLHNIGYYITKPFARIPKINVLNLRFKDVDLMVDMITTEEGG